MRFEKIDNQLYTNIIHSDPSKRWPIEQSPLWGAFQNEIPDRHYVGTFILKNNDQTVAYATVTEMHMRGYSYAWVNQGPVWLVKPTKKLVQDVATCLTQIAKTECQTPLLFVRAYLPMPARGAVSAHSKALIEKTTIVDLTQPFENVLAAMNYGARRGMRKAEKQGVQIREVPQAEAAAHFAPYYAILQETTSRDGFFGHPQGTYETMLRALKGHARLFAAFNAQNQPIAWALDTVYEGHAIYYYGASNQEARQNMAPYLMQIEIMRKLQAEGIKSYDFLGIGSAKFPGLQGVTQFKLRFGGEVVDYTPAYDLPLNSLKYKLWVHAQKARYKLRHLR